ncbi:hypothetical protein HZA87_04620, partial [Candidatus Uhrbacteria bacterium]|nr:hypothetical protein [Candidatus Uhrbacteria bacterium]
LMLAGVLLLPALFVSAQEGGQNGQQDRPGKPGVPVQIVSIATGSNGSGTIQATLERVPEKVTEDFGVEEGDTLTITFTAETTFFKDKEEATISDFAVGDVIFAAGDVNLEELTVAADHVSDRLPKFTPKCQHEDEEGNPVDEPTNQSDIRE